MSTSKIIKAYITDLNGNRITGAYVSDTVTALTYDGQTYTRNAQTGRSFAIAKDCDDFVAYLYNPDEAVSDGLVATFEGDLQWSDAPVLPTVDANQWLNYAGGSTKSFSPDQTSDAYYWTGSGYSPLSYDSEKAYSIVEIRNRVNVFYGRVQLSIFNNSGAMAVRNVSDQTFESSQSKYAVCSSNQATVVTVYNSSNAAYNAFKYTANGTDYYYVLDGTQTDWTDDLASIGYHLPAQYIEVMLNLSRSMNTVTFSANDYWASYAQLTVTVSALNDFGVPLRELNGAKFISATALSDFSFEPVGLYADNGTDVHADMSNFYCAAGGNNPDSDYGNNVNIFSINAYSTPVFTWKCRITKNS